MAPSGCGASVGYVLTLNGQPTPCGRERRTPSCTTGIPVSSYIDFQIRTTFQELRTAVKLQWFLSRPKLTAMEVNTRTMKHDQFFWRFQAKQSRSSVMHATTGASSPIFWGSSSELYISQKPFRTALPFWGHLAWN